MTGRWVRSWSLIATGLVAVAVAAVPALTSVPAAAATLSVTAGKVTVSARSYESGTACTLSADADSYVARELAGSNFGGATSVQFSSDAVATRRAFLHFTLSGCSPSIPSDALVQSAKVRLTVSAVAAATRTYELHAASSSWDETSITWSNQPGVSSTVTGTAAVSTGAAAGTVVEWTATSDVQDFVTGAATNAGWRISDSSEGGVGTPLLLNSRDASSGTPQLVITYLP
jgi:hypothetical protein